MNKLLFKFIFLACTFGIYGVAVSKDSNNPYIYILGVTQDAGFPQAGCYKPHCMKGWNDVILRRGATSIGLIDPETKKKYMFDATPYFSSQLYDLEVEAPSEQFKFAGIFLTHAHIGHYAGLMFLGHEVMGALNTPVFAMPRMTNFLQENGPWSQLVEYKNISIKPLKDKQVEKLDRLKITPFLVPHRDEFSETVGYRIDGTNKSAIFIPDIDKWQAWSTDIVELVKSVDYALIDATFFADGELPGRDMSKIKHPFVSESMDVLKELSPEDRNKVWFIHMNHTNPLLNIGSPESKLITSEGFNIATEGVRLEL